MKGDRILTEEQLQSALRRIGDISRQFGSIGGYPYDPEKALQMLQWADEGAFGFQLGVCEFYKLTINYNQHNPIDRLVKQGGPWENQTSVDNWFHDTTYPDVNKNVGGSGLVVVKLVVIPGSELVNLDVGVVNESYMRRQLAVMRMRFANPAEALLIPANDHNIGRVRPLFVFTQGCFRSDVFKVSGDNGHRYLSANVHHLDCPVEADYVAVCDQEVVS